jgi:NAD(P)H dehydrogenase (quinone)
MKIMVVLGHPNINSFNKAIFDITIKILKKNKHEVFSHDLYDEKFDPVITGEELSDDKTNDKLVLQYCDEIKNADGIIIIHPNWWGQPPAILKGWVDRVFRENIAYKFSEDDKGGGIPVGLLKAKMAVVFNTSNTNEKRELELFQDPLETLWKNCIFSFCGVKEFYRKTFRIIADSDIKQRLEWLDDVENIIDASFPLE